METEQKPITPVKYSDKERTERSCLITYLEEMKRERDMAHDELDGMTYPQYYESNRKKDLSYIPPKKNKHDPRS